MISVFRAKKQQAMERITGLPSPPRPHPAQAPRVEAGGVTWGLLPTALGVGVGYAP